MVNASCFFIYLKELRNYVEEFQFWACNDVGGIMAFNA